MNHYHLILVKELPTIGGETNRTPKENRLYLTVNNQRLVYGALVNGAYLVHEIVINANNPNLKKEQMAVLDDIKQLIAQNPIGKITLYQQAIINKALLPGMVLNPQLYRFPELYEGVKSLNPITALPLFILEQDIDNLPCYIMLQHYNEEFYRQSQLHRHITNCEISVTNSLYTALRTRSQKVLGRPIVDKIGVVAVNMEACDAAIVIKAQDIEQSSIIPIQYVDSVDRNIYSVIFTANSAVRACAFNSYLNRYLATGKPALLNTIQLTSISVEPVTISNNTNHPLKLAIKAIWHGLLVVQGQNKAILHKLKSLHVSQHVYSQLFVPLRELDTLNHYYLSILNINGYQPVPPYNPLSAQFSPATIEQVIELTQHIRQQNKQLVAIFANYQAPGSNFPRPELLEPFQQQLSQVTQTNQTVFEQLALEEQQPTMVSSCDDFEQSLFEQQLSTVIAASSSASTSSNPTFFNNKKRKLDASPSIADTSIQSSDVDFLSNDSLNIDSFFAEDSDVVQNKINN